MNKDYRGDTFFRSYSLKIDGELYNFQQGDKLKVAFCLFGVDKKLIKEISLTEGETEANVVWSAEEMATLALGDYILEAEFNTIDFTKTYQENIKISEDFIYGEE
jgi:hypothetical protein